MRNLETRKVNQIRNIQIEKGYAPNGTSIIFHMGETIVHCATSVEEKKPFFVGEGQGWLTAEYSMLPFSTSSRNRRDRDGKVNSRSVEIQRLIGRSLRGIVHFEKLGERTLTIDCDVLKADGGTRCASISGGYISLVLALQQLEKQGLLKVSEVLKDSVAAVSVGIVESQNLLDLQYTEDFAAEVDLNVVMTGKDQLIEVQGTAEGKSFSRTQLNEMLDLAQVGIQDILAQGKSFLSKM